MVYLTLLVLLVNISVLKWARAPVVHRMHITTAVGVAVKGAGSSRLLSLFTIVRGLHLGGSQLSMGSGCRICTAS